MSSSSSNNSNETPSPPTVAVIGCGPGGMFFLHAIETQRRELQAKGDTEGLKTLPIATCFERAPSPGGVWRAEREFIVDKEEKKTDESSHAPLPNMYEALWTNGAKENTEFFDYTYDDHFGCRLPVHLPRRAVLDYMMARVTRHAPTLFQDHARFNTSVVSVKYKEDASKFVVISRNSVTGITSTDYFDKCIWAAGDNGKPKMPLLSKFANYTGTIIHSSDARDLDTNVRGKRVLMVGGSYSAEDLALMAIKLGVEHIYISHRGEEDHVTFTSQWPQNKVTLLSEQIPTSACGRSIEFAEVAYDCDKPGSYKIVYEAETTIHDIDTVIMCTGYESNMTMLDKELQPPSHPTEYDDFSVPSDWKMTENAMTPEIGDISPAPLEYYSNCSYVKPGLYRGVLMSNPSMMFVSIFDAEEPLMMCDAMAWAFLAYITGKTPLPNQKEMTRRNQADFLREYELPQTRFYLDNNYRQAIEELGEDHWFNDSSDERSIAMQKKQYLHAWLLCARIMQEGHYPFDLGDYETATLSEDGKKMFAMNWMDGEQRAFPDQQDESEVEWRTFRDLYPEYAENFASVFTGTKAVPLKKRWMDIDESANEQLW